MAFPCRQVLSRLPPPVRASQPGRPGWLSGGHADCETAGRPRKKLTSVGQLPPERWRSLPARILSFPRASDPNEHPAQPHAQADDIYQHPPSDESHNHGDQALSPSVNYYSSPSRLVSRVFTDMFSNRTHRTGQVRVHGPQDGARTFEPHRLSPPVACAPAGPAGPDLLQRRQQSPGRSRHARAAEHVTAERLTGHSSWSGRSTTAHEHVPIRPAGRHIRPLRCGTFLLYPAPRCSNYGSDLWS